ncbi:hypothetical protein AALA24_03470 [Anaerovoracaceae bacterium 42-11]
MGNPIKNAFDKASLIKDIDERNSIIFNYQRYGLLDRDDAIKKIQELRISDEDVAVVTTANLSVSSIPFSQSTNDQIVRELVMQRDILQAKLIKKNTEEQK